MATQPTTMTKDEWLALGEELFGTDRYTWKFRCPACGNVMSVERGMREFGDAIAAKNWRPESECIGRYTEDVACDWCAYGLFSGPNFVAIDGTKTVAVFPFAEE